MSVTKFVLEQDTEFVAFFWKQLERKSNIYLKKPQINSIKNSKSGNIFGVKVYIRTFEI